VNFPKTQDEAITNGIKFLDQHAPKDWRQQLVPLTDRALVDTHTCLLGHFGLWDEWGARDLRIAGFNPWHVGNFKDSASAWNKALGLVEVPK